MSVSVRTATQTDTERLCALTRRSIEELGASAYDDEQLAAWAGGVAPSLYPIDSPDARVLVAEDSDDVVGVGWARWGPMGAFEAPVDGEITGIYVHPAAAGNGIGSTLLDRLEGVVADHGVDSIGLWASRNAAPFYKKRGYTRVTTQSIEYGDVTLPVVELSKPIC